MRRSLPATTAIILLTAVSVPAKAQHSLATLPLSDPAYVQLDGLDRQGCHSAHVSPYRPYAVGRIREALAAARGDAGCAGPILDDLVARFTKPAPDEDPPSEEPTRFSAGGEVTLRTTAHQNGVFRPLWLDVRSTRVGEESAVGIVRARVGWNGGSRLFAVTEAFAQTGTRNDPTIRARRFRTSSGVLDFSEAYVAAGIGPLTVSLGRGAEAWLSEGEESLSLSAHGPPMDRLSASARWSRWEARSVFASVNDVLLDEVTDSLVAGNPPQRFHRFLAAHSITFRASNAVELTVGETALLSRRGSGVDLAFVNPLMPFVVTEHDTTRAGSGADDNNLTAFGAVRINARRANVQAELLVDDIQIDAADRKRTPDQLAWRVSGNLGLPLFRPVSLGLEFLRADSYTYMRQSYAIVYQQYDRPIGSQIGPDSYMFKGYGELWATGRLRFSGSAGMLRRGALRIGQRPGTSAVGRANEMYPSITSARPVVQRAWLMDGSVDWLDGIMPVSLRTEVAHVKNVNNTQSTGQTYLRAQLVGSYRFRYP